MGTLPKESLIKAVNGKNKAIQTCYQSARVKNPKLAGKLVFKLIFSEDGKVTKASIEKNEFNSPVAESCMLGVLSTLSVPANEIQGISIATYPFVFSLGKSE